MSLKLSETCTLRSVPTDQRLVLGLGLPGDSSSAATDPLSMQHSTFEKAHPQGTRQNLMQWLCTRQA